MLLRSAFRKPLRDWLVFGATIILLGAIRVSLTFLPFRAVRSALDRLKSNRFPFPRAVSLETSVWAVKAASRFIPRASCLTQALALEFILMVQGIDARINFGVAKSPVGHFQAHAWVESGARTVLGESAGVQYTPLSIPSAQMS